MDQSSIDSALKVTWTACDDVRTLILDEGRRNLEAALSASAGLQSRLVQAAGLLYAAATLAATTTLTTSGPVAALMATASISFALGGSIAFLGIQSRQIVLPGLPPSWWAASKDLPKWTLKDAHYWLAGHIEQALAAAVEAQRRRAGSLYYSLVAGGCGGLMMAVAAVWRVLS